MKTPKQKEFEQRKALEYREYIDDAKQRLGLTGDDLQTLTKVGLIRHGLEQQQEGWICLKYLAKELDILFRTQAMAKAYSKVGEAGTDVDPDAVDKVERLSKAFKVYDQSFRLVDSDATERLMSCLDGWDAKLSDMEDSEFRQQVGEDIDEMIGKLQEGGEV